MDLYSSFAGFIEVIASPGEIVVDDNLFGEHPWLTLIIEPVFLYGQSPVVLPSFLMDCSVLLLGDDPWLILKVELLLVYGYLPRPPENHSVFGSFTELVCMWLHPSGNLSFVDAAVIVECRDVCRKGKLQLSQFRPHHVCDILLIMIFDGVGVISEIVLALCCVDEYIHLVSMASEAVFKMLLVSRGLRVMPTDGYGLYATDVAIHNSHGCSSPRIIQGTVCLLCFATALCLNTFADSDFGMCLDSRRSVSGVCVFLGMQW